jgi:hypothetical protein
MKIVLNGLKDGQRTSWILSSNVGTCEVDILEIRNMELTN